MRSIVLLSVLLAAALPAQARVFQVTKTADSLDGVCDHDCSLREAVAAANAAIGADTILVPAGLYELTREGASDDQNATGDLDVRGSLHLLGAGADKTILDGRGLDRVLQVVDDSHLEVADVTIRNGKVPSVPRLLTSGGGIWGADLVVWRTWITGNQADFGGGLFSYRKAVVNESTVSGNRAVNGGGIYMVEGVINNSTISGNHATEAGGGLATEPAGTTVSNSTITGNTALVVGGGYVSFSDEDQPSGGSGPDVRGGLGFRNSILAGNSAPVGPDCSGELSSEGYNLVGNTSGCETYGNRKTDQYGSNEAPLDPVLVPLGFYGGPTPTHALRAGSPAIDRGSLPTSPLEAAFCQGLDQRGRNRPADGDGDGNVRCDIGAVEYVETCLTTGLTLCLADRFEVTATWTIPGVASGPAQPNNISRDTGTFWFVDPKNLELTVKALDGCGVNGHFWVFVSGLTDLPVTLTVRDTRTGQTRTYTNPANTAFQTKLDTAAFSCVDTFEPAAAAQANDFETKEQTP